jgi:hypothetical protein
MPSRQCSTISASRLLVLALLLGVLLACERPALVSPTAGQAPSPTREAATTAVAQPSAAPAMSTAGATATLRSAAHLPLVQAGTKAPTPLATSNAPGGGAYPYPLPATSAPSSSATATLAATPGPSPTRTTRPTNTPIPWPDPLDQPSASKLGLHVQWNNSPHIMKYIRNYRPAVVKGMDDLGFMAEVKEASPSTVTVGRLSKDEQNTDGDPVERARAYVAMNLETYRSFPGVDYWEGLNEPGVRGRMDWYATFEVERVRSMAEQGLRCAVGAFSAGTPEYDEIEAFLPAIRAAKENGGILTLHEYDAPLFNRSIGEGLPGVTARPDRGPLALRYRWWYEDFLKPRDLVIPLVISEAGVDGKVANHPGPEGRGWRDFSTYWSEQGLGGDDVKTYLSQLAWYDGEVRKDDYVLGYAVFTAGAMSDDWRSYDITSILRQIAHYVIKQK